MRRFCRRYANDWSPRLAPVIVYVRESSVNYNYMIGCVVEVSPNCWRGQYVEVSKIEIFASTSGDPVMRAVGKCLQKLEEELLRGIMIGDNFSLYAPDITKALTADIAERFGDIPIRVTYGPELPFNTWTLRVSGGENFAYSLLCVDPHLCRKDYEVMKDAVLQLIFEWMEKDEEDEL